MGVMRIGHASVRVMDMKAAVQHYTEVLGMKVTMEDKAGNVYLKCWDEPNHHSLRLIYGPRVGMDQMSFKVEREDDLDDFESRIQAYGYPVERVSKGMRIGQGESIRFETPSGQTMELVHDVEMVGRATAPVNPAPFVEGLKGIAPPRLDHVLVTAEEVGDAVEGEVLHRQPEEGDVELSRRLPAAQLDDGDRPAERDERGGRRRRLFPDGRLRIGDGIRFGAPPARQLHAQLFRRAREGAEARAQRARSRCWPAPAPS